MSERSISQIIADLKATCAPGSDVGLLCQFAEQVCAEWKQIEREAESEDGADQQRYLRGLFGHMIRQRKACTKLHEQIKSLNGMLANTEKLWREQKHDLQLATNNAAACMRVANERHEEIELLGQALAWSLTRGANVSFYDRPAKLFDKHNDILDPPSHLRATIESVIGEKR